MMLRSTLLLLLALFADTATATSLDCSQAASFADKTICRDQVLSEMNDALNLVYREALQVIRNPAALQSDQQKWLAAQNACTVAKCVDDGITSRMSALNQLIRTERAPVKVNTKASNPAPEKGLWQRFVDGPAWKYAMTLLVIGVVACVFLHRRETLTVYTNFTDALVTNLVPLGALIVWGLLAWLELPSPIPQVIAVLMLVLAAVFAWISSWNANDALWKVVASFLCKMMLVSVFYALVLFLLLLLMPTRKKGETRREAEIRNYNQQVVADVVVQEMSYAYTFLSVWLCRYVEFSSLSDCMTHYASYQEVEEQV
ncbi:hypothetical protein PS3A_26120 [Pseudomonas sp. 3A(2025)]